MLLDIDLAQFPREPELAFVELVTRLEAKVNATRKQEDSHVYVNQYIDSVTAFIEEYNFPWDHHRSPPNEEHFDEWFWELRGHARRLAMRFRLRYRTKPHMDLLATVMLTPDFRQEIHGLINTIPRS